MLNFTKIRPGESLGISSRFATDVRTCLVKTSKQTLYTTSLQKLQCFSRNSDLAETGNVFP